LKPIAVNFFFPSGEEEKRREFKRTQKKPPKKKKKKKKKNVYVCRGFMIINTCLFKSPWQAKKEMLEWGGKGNPAKETQGS